ncbi:ABC-2 family transporter protein [Rhodospirillaceae bacterium SYSU D60014]|uniref:ABC-2 family transporter protein n=1 Tax=Virgifigura deserti TaxID=2268457 RepID=UPI000E673423
MNSRALLSYFSALVRHNLRAGLAQPGIAATSALLMFGNNLIFFLVWVIYFANFSNLRGWGLKDLALLIGICAWAFGLTVVFVGGVRHMAHSIVDGELDVHLGRPRHPLLSLLMSRSLPSGFGDLASAFVFWIWLADRGLDELPFLLLVATAAAVVLAATAALIQCLVFWLPGAVLLCEEVFNMFLMVGFYPQHPFGFTVRLVLFTVFPTAFVTLLPVEAVREADPLKALAVLGAAVFYAGLAVTVFNRGLRRYASGNRLLELR